MGEVGVARELIETWQVTWKSDVLRGGIIPGSILARSQNDAQLEGL
jgi:hypothetical protein